jgi:hypothetical protein
MDRQRYWFAAKRIGWGLSPASPAGWIATIAFVIVDLGGTFALMPFVLRSQPNVLVWWALFWSLVFLALALMKAEPGWWKKWGDGT